MKVLVACEFSGRVREAFRKLGHDAWSCDLIPTEQESRYHVQGDVLNILDDGWDLMIAHPTCTYLANSGVRWLYKHGTRIRVPERWTALAESAAFFKALLAANIPRIAVENPIMHRYGKKAIGCGDPSQIIQPWMFGDGETKATCLWLKNLPLLVPTDIVKGRVQKTFLEPPSPERWKNRSRTYMGIAKAMAEQWGCL